MYRVDLRPFETPQERSNRLRREWQTVQQAIACAHLFLAMTHYSCL
jgi:hypothetical protein